jgi:hypothetical protein
MIRINYKYQGKQAMLKFLIDMRIIKKRRKIKNVVWKSKTNYMYL